MTALVDRITAAVEPVIRNDLHAPVPVPPSVIAAHVAVQVAALLTEERTAQVKGFDTPHGHGAGTHWYRRWVSEWTAAEPEEPRRDGKCPPPPPHTDSGGWSIYGRPE